MARKVWKWTDGMETYEIMQPIHLPKTLVEEVMEFYGISQLKAMRTILEAFMMRTTATYRAGGVVLISDEGELRMASGESIEEGDEVADHVFTDGDEIKIDWQ